MLLLIYLKIYLLRNERVYFMAPELVELNEVEGWTNYAVKK